MVAQVIPNASGCMSLEDYFNYDDGTDTRYELVDGVLVATIIPQWSLTAAQILAFGSHS